MGQACSKSYPDRHRYREEFVTGQGGRLEPIAYLSSKQHAAEIKYMKGIPSTMVVDAPNKLLRVSKLRVIRDDATLDDNLRAAVYDFVETVGGQVTADKDVAADSVVTLLYADLHGMLKTSFVTQKGCRSKENEEVDDGTDDEEDDDDEYTGDYEAYDAEDGGGGGVAFSKDVGQGEDQEKKKDQEKKELFYVEESFSMPMFTQSTLVKVDVIIGILSPSPTCPSFISHSSSLSRSVSNLNSYQDARNHCLSLRNQRHQSLRHRRAQSPRRSKTRQGSRRNERLQSTQTGVFYVADVSFINLASLSFTEICFLTDIALCTRLYARSHIVIAQLLYRTAVMENNRRAHHATTINTTTTFCVNCNKEEAPQLTCAVCQFSDLHNLISKEYEHLNNSVESPNSKGDANHN